MAPPLHLAQNLMQTAPRQPSPRQRPINPRHAQGQGRQAPPGPPSQPLFNGRDAPAQRCQRCQRCGRALNGPPLPVPIHGQALSILYVPILFFYVKESSRTLSISPSGAIRAGIPVRYLLKNAPLRGFPTPTTDPR